MKKLVTYIIITIVIMNLFSISAFSLNETEVIDVEMDTCSEELIQELTVTKAETETEIVIEIVNNQMQPFAVSTQSSFSSLVGGTLLLDYVGDINVFSQTTFKKVVYLNSEQTLFF